MVGNVPVPSLQQSGAGPEPRAGRWTRGAQGLRAHRDLCHVYTNYQWTFLLVTVTHYSFIKPYAHARFSASFFPPYSPSFTHTHTLSKQALFCFLALFFHLSYFVSSSFSFWVSSLSFPYKHPSHTHFSSYGALTSYVAFFLCLSVKPLEKAWSVWDMFLVASHTAARAGSSFPPDQSPQQATLASGNTSNDWSLSTVPGRATQSAPNQPGK